MGFMVNKVPLYFILRRCHWRSYIVRKGRRQVKEEKKTLGGNTGLIS
jgi:hypothetical protein